MGAPIQISISWCERSSPHVPTPRITTSTSVTFLFVVLLFFITAWLIVVKLFVIFKHYTYSLSISQEWWTLSLPVNDFVCRLTCCQMEHRRCPKHANVIQVWKINTLGRVYLYVPWKFLNTEYRIFQLRLYAFFIIYFFSNNSTRLLYFTFPVPSLYLVCKITPFRFKIDYTFPLYFLSLNFITAEN